MVEQTLSASDISELRDYPSLLYILLGRADRLDSTARTALFRLLKENIDRDNEVDRDNNTDPMLLELCEELSLDTQKARQAISRRLTREVLHEKMPNASAINGMYFYLLKTGDRDDKSGVV